jgi:uncharacterized protein DUF3987/bifunctional DNA primase/polymerase-like protein/primase-like protein
MSSLSTGTELQAAPVQFSAAFDIKKAAKDITEKHNEEVRRLKRGATAPEAVPELEPDPRTLESPRDERQLDTRKTRLEAAREAVRRGFYVFPLASNSKTPALEGDWHEHATQDDVKLVEWFGGRSGFNIAGRTDHLLVVDVDPKKGGDIGLQYLSLAGEMPETGGTTTHSGGFHLMYALPPDVRVGNSTEKIAVGVDVKSADGYVVLPGSTISGKAYKWTNDRAPVPAPEWLIEECGRADDRPPNAGKRLVEEDDWARDRSWKYLVEEAAESSEGSRNADCVRHANRCFDFALDIDSCIAYMLEWNNGKCFPPLESDEIERTVRSAAKSRKKAFGCDHPLAPGFDPYEMPPPDTEPKISPSTVPQDQPWPAVSGYEAARSYIDNESPDESDIPDRDIAAVIVAATLRKFMPLTGLQIATLMRDWSLAAYGRDIDDEALKRALVEMCRLEALEALPPTEGASPPATPDPAVSPRVEEVGASIAPITLADVPPAPAKTKAVAPSTMAEALSKKAAAAATKEGWREPANLWADVPAPAALPLDAVPDVISRSAQDRARRLGVAPAAPAASMITTMGALVPAGNQLQMRQNDPEWLVKAILWTMIIGAPGSNKSATISSAVAPARKVEAAWQRSHAADLRAYEALKAAQKERNGKRKTDDAAEIAKTEAATSIAGEAVSSQTIAEDIFAGVPVLESPPRFRQKIANDATTEALAEMLADNPDGIFYVADELAGLFGSMDIYRPKGGKDRPFWLQAKDGGAYTVNRKTSDRVLIANCALSVLGGIQPDKIRKLAAGLSEDGMLQRFAPIFLDRHGNGEDICPDTELNEMVARVASMIAGAASGAVFKFAPEADAELREIEAFKAREITKPNAAPSLRQWLDKLPNEYGRVSLAFHFIEWASGAAGGERPPDIIRIETARRARRYLTEFVYSHARAFYEQIGSGSGAGDHGLWIAGYILARGLGSIDARDIYRAYPALRAKERRDDIARVMQDLEMLDWVRTTKIKNNVPTEWAVNPAVEDGRFTTIAEAERLRRGEVVKRIQEIAKTAAAA